MHGREITGVAAILVHGDNALLLFGDLDQVLRLAERRGKRLVDDDVTAGEETLFGDRMMGRVWCRDDDEVDLAAQHLIDAANEFDVGIARIGWPVPLHDRAEEQPVHRANDRRVKDLPREAETDEAHVEHDRVSHYPGLNGRRRQRLSQ